jgi:predicted acylesterase/phospholipase RssA
MNIHKGRQNVKTALVLAGGGLTGAVYEIGALRAIDDLLVDRTVNDFDIYVGTSAGALVASLLANGFSPESMLQIMAGSNPDVETIKRKHIFNFNKKQFLQWSLKFPSKLLKAGSQYLLSLNDMTFFDLLWSLTEAMPPGIYDVMGIESYLRNLLTELGISNNFNELPRDLFIIATELDSGDRVVFGPKIRDEIPISTAVAASSALPLLYKPLQIGEEEYVDGGLRGNASLDLAIEHGAKLVVCINPMVPYEHHHGPSLPYPAAKEMALSDKGIQSIANQALRIVTHSGLHYHIKQLRRSHPEVDIILIEPRGEDYQMFFYNIMRYSARLIVARHGFESATLDLAEEYPRYKQILARHGIPITRRLVIDEIAEIQQSGYDAEVIQKVLEARMPGCGQRKFEDPFCELNRALAELELTLEEISEEVETAQTSA